MHSMFKVSKWVKFTRSKYGRQRSNISDFNLLFSLVVIEMDLLRINRLQRRLVVPQIYNFYDLMSFNITEI